MVPKAPREHLNYRKQILKESAADRSLREELWIACSRDLLFWVNTFLWTYDPRKPTAPVVPFNTWAYQDELLAEIDQATGVEDMVVEKSRDMGVSWCFLAHRLWRFQFQDYQSFLMASRKAELVDQPGDPDSLFWKIDFMIANQPAWLSGPIERSKMHFEHLRTKSTIDGESTNNDLSRGGRRTAIDLDEFGAVLNGDDIQKATRDATNSRLFVSTPKPGTGGSFTRLCKKPGVRKSRLKWTLHPEKRRGLYTAIAGKLHIIDKDHKFPPDYEFILDGKERSPWYDEQCRRAANAIEIACEVDIDHHGAEYRFFDLAILDKLELSCRPPVHMGELDFDPDECTPTRFTAIERGNLRIWCALGAKGFPPDGNYVVGGDIAMGIGTGSDSVLAVYDKKTGEKVAELATSSTLPSDLAKYAVALARFFHGALLIWEANGPGREFGQVVVAVLQYGNVFYRKREDTVLKKTTDIPGWWSTKITKRVLLSDYRAALKDGRLINRSAAAITECREYVCLNDDIVHVKSRDLTNSTESGDNHGDRVIADAVAYRGLTDLSAATKASTKPEAPLGSFAHRRKKYQERLAQKASW